MVKVKIKRVQRRKALGDGSVLSRLHASSVF